MEYHYNLKIPVSRVAVLIGKEGSVKKEIEDLTRTKISVDSKEGDVLITAKEGIDIYTAKEIIKAIARGFNPEIAKSLLKQDYVLKIIDLSQVLGKTSSQIKRIKGRIIGKEGKSREVIENLTKTNISVFGKTICIIGDSISVDLASRAIEMLINGSLHSTVYSFLEREKKKSRQMFFDESHLRDEFKGKK